MGIGNTNIQKGERRDRLVQERIHDPYRPRGQLSEPSVCCECGVVFLGGRWQWVEQGPDVAEEILCPACRRVRDRVPAGFLTLGGDFFAEHRDEILRLVENKVERQKAQHPMQRIMDVTDEPDGETVISFTDIHLPQGVGTAIESAYEGDLDIKLTDEAGIIRAVWRR